MITFLKYLPLLEPIIRITLEAFICKNNETLTKEERQIKVNEAFLILHKKR